MSDVINANSDTFEEAVSEGWALVDIWGPQCAPCVALAPHVERLPEKWPALRIVKVEAPKARRLCIDLKVVGMPTLLLFRDGSEVGRITDSSLTPDQMYAWLEEQLEPAP